MNSMAPPTLAGYRYLKSLGSGGFSEVFQYRQDATGRRVAVKVLLAGTLDAKVLRDFAAETRIMARLEEHPNIVSVLDASTTDDARPYVVMAYYPPPDMLQRTERRGLPVPAVLRYGIQLAGALETIHRAHVIHRDIKPANILLDKSDAPILIDFGIAGRVQAIDTDDDVGVSLPWSAPEVVSGRSNGSIASDIYSLGATLWHLLVGRSPFHIPGDPAQNAPRPMTGRVLTTPAPSTGIADCPSSLDRLLTQCMAKRPEMRPRSAEELASTLQTIEAALGLPRTEAKFIAMDMDEDDPFTFELPSLLTQSPSAAAPAPPSRESASIPSSSKAAAAPEAMPVRAQPDADLSEHGALTRTRHPLVSERAPTAVDEASTSTIHRAPIAKPQSSAGAPESDFATEHRPRRVVPSPDEGAFQTELRPPTVKNTESDNEPQQHRARVKLWVAAFAALGAALGGAYALSALGGPSDGTSSSTGTVAPAPDDLVPSSAPPKVPNLKVRIKSGKSSFTWRESAGTHYLYITQRSSAESPAASPLTLRPNQGACIQLIAVDSTTGAESRTEWTCLP